MTTVDPTVMTDSDPAIGNADSVGASRSRVMRPRDARGRARTDRSSAGSPTTTRNLRRALRALFEPPEIWSEDRPGLRRIVWYHLHGSHLPASGPGRAVAVLWMPFAVVVAAVAYYTQWITERPSRVAAALLLYVVLAHCGLGLPRPHWLP